MKIAFLGPIGTYTHQAVLQQFPDGEILPQPSISACFDAIEHRDVDYAVVPFENSTNGQVVFTYDLLRDRFLLKKSDFKIVAEQYVAIHHNVLSNTTLDKATVLYSHPQVWTQCTQFLDTVKNLRRVDTASTAQAAQMVHDDTTNSSACISSQMSAELYKLPIVEASVEDNKDNTTRFLVLGHDALPITSAPVTSAIFTLNSDNPGALCDVLSCFKQHGVNLSSINSRPSHQEQWQYVFFVELDGNAADETVAAALADVSASCNEMVVLGTFGRNWRRFPS
ncbi:probable prephenate dehydratase [Diutina catenulata]